MNIGLLIIVLSISLTVAAGMAAVPDSLNRLPPCVDGNFDHDPFEFNSSGMSETHIRR
jgi:hypothetical protein